MSSRMTNYPSLNPARMSLERRKHRNPVRKQFAGVYGVINGGPGYVFHKDGTIEVVTTHDAEVTKDKISFGGLSYGWRMKDGKVEFLDISSAGISTDKQSDSKDDENSKSEPRVAITMVPTDGTD